MFTPSIFQFRFITVLALLCWLASVVLPHTGAIAFSEEVATARMWNYFESIIAFWLIQVWWVVSALLTVIGLIGVFWFWNPGRWLLVAAMVAAILLQPLIGLAVYSPFEASMAGVFGASVFWLIGVSFYSQLALRFQSHAAKST